MSRRFIGARIAVIVVMLALAVLPGMVWAQGVWPPLEVYTGVEAQGNVLRYALSLKNVSGVDLADVQVKSSLPAGVVFQRFETAGYATMNFDGKDLTFTVIKVPAGQTVGPMYFYIDPKGAAADTLKTRIWGDWKGQTPGGILVSETKFGGGLAKEGAAPAAPAAPAAAPTAAPAAKAEAPAPAPAAPKAFDLWDQLKKLKSYKMVDLTNTFAPGIPRWSGFDSAQFKTLYDYDKDGFFAQEFIHVGQYGTHMDPPGHFHKGMRLIDQIQLQEMMAPLVVINAAAKVAANPDYELTVNDIKEWEAKYGPVPEGAFVAMRSDWSKRWPDPVAYENKDAKGQSHYPGWTLDSLKYLYETRKIVGSGHEPADTDSAVAQNTTGFAAETYVLGTDHYQIELLTNLDKVPEAGAIVFVTVPKPKAGSGFPARVFAVVP